MEMEGGVGGGGWWAHPPAVATLGKMALGASVGFLGITIRRHCHSKREAMGTKSETLLCSRFQALGVGRALVGVACTMAVIFGTRKER